MVNIKPDLDELPEELYVPLGSRGFQPLKLKRCNYCKMEESARLKLLEKKIKEDGNVEIVDYKIRCENCRQIFTIRCKNYYEICGDIKKRLLSRVHILNDAEVDQGWLGCF